MSKIYVVTSGEYSDYHIDAIVSTKELAKIYCNGSESDIEEWEMDGEVGKECRVVYRCQMPGGDCWTYSHFDLPTKRTPDEPISEYGSGFVADSYVSQEHARKLAIEEWQKRLREKGWPQ